MDAQLHGLVFVYVHWYAGFIDWYKNIVISWDFRTVKSKGSDGSCNLLWRNLTMTRHVHTVYPDMRSQPRTVTFLEVMGNKQVCNHCATVSPLVFTVWQNANRKQWETTYNTQCTYVRKRCMQGNIRTHDNWRMYCPGEDNQLSCSETGDVTSVHKRITLFHARHQGDQPRFRIIFSVDKTRRVAVGWQTLVVF